MRRSGADEPQAVPPEPSARKRAEAGGHRRDEQAGGVLTAWGAALCGSPEARRPPSDSGGIPAEAASGRGGRATKGALPTRFLPAERASEEDLRRQVELFERNEIAQLLADSLPVIFVIMNSCRQIVFAGRAVVDLAGAPDKERIYGLRHGEVWGCVHALESEGGCGTTEFCKTCGAGKVAAASLKGKSAVQECRIERRLGDALDFRVWAVPFATHEGPFVLFSAIDVSNEKRRRVLERIFFHDVLNRAGVLQGLASLLAETDQSEELVSLLERNSDQLVEEINAQRDLAAAESEELHPNLMAVETGPILDAVRNDYSKHPVAAGREIIVADDSENVVFTSDGTLLRRVVGNLVKNGLEACSTGERVSMRSLRRDGEVLIEVHSPGFMPREVQLQMFQRSFSTKGSGRGLGTYSVKLLTERYLGGNVTFETSRENGTTFRLRYPG